MGHTTTTINIRKQKKWNLIQFFFPLKPLKIRDTWNIIWFTSLKLYIMLVGFFLKKKKSTIFYNFLIKDTKKERYYLLYYQWRTHHIIYNPKLILIFFFLIAQKKKKQISQRFLVSNKRYTNTLLYIKSGGRLFAIFPKKTFGNFKIKKCMKVLLKQQPTHTLFESFLIFFIKS